MAGKTPKKLFLVDAMGFVFRAFFAPMGRLNNAAGIPTKVPYLFSNMLRKLVREAQPDYIAVVFDPRGPTFRDKLFTEYKAQRPPMPEDLSIQLPYVRRICEAMRLPTIEVDGYEADDVIGALSRQGAERRLDVYIVTSDKDMMQLVGGHVLVLRPGSGPNKGDLIVDAAKVEELMGVPPEKVADVMALMGDSIDNIPGAKGIGEKGARVLIRRFGSAEAALEHAAEVEGKLHREALLNSKERVMLSKQLATIAADAPIALDLAAVERREPDWAALRDLYAELGFNSLLAEIPPKVGVPTEWESLPPEKRGLDKFLFDLMPSEELAVWAEARDNEQRFGAEGIEAFELCHRPGVVCYAKLRPQPGRLEFQEPLADRVRTVYSVEFEKTESMVREVSAWLSKPEYPKIVHDPKQLESLTGPVSGVRHATMLYSYLLNPTTPKHELADVVQRYENATLSGAPGEKADHLQTLARKLRQEVDAQDLASVYETIDLPLAPVLAAMERHGIRVAPAALAAMSDTMETEIRALEKRIWELGGTEFNVNSPQQLAEILFDKLNLATAGRRSKAKARSTAADVLAELALLHELPRKVIEYRELAKLKSTYVDALPKLIEPATGRLHTRLSQTVAATGRLSSSDPNLQNIPVRSELGRQIRAAFVADPSWTLLSADYSQIELRILAHFSEDPVLVEAFRTGQDIHARTAQEVFGIGPMAQTPEHRRVAKVINFGIIYGLSPFGLAQQLGIEQREAAKFIAAYFQRYRGVKEYLDRSLDDARREGFTRTLFGRRRPIPEIVSPQANLRNFAERTALNTPLQGTAADLIKLAMIHIQRELVAQSFRARMILQVHDELLFEAPPGELDRLRALVGPAMEQAHKLLVPLVVEMKAGPNWRDMR